MGFYNTSGAGLESVIEPYVKWFINTIIQLQKSKLIKIDNSRFTITDSTTGQKDIKLKLTGNSTTRSTSHSMINNALRLLKEKCKCITSFYTPQSTYDELNIYISDENISNIIISRLYEH